MSYRYLCNVVLCLLPAFFMGAPALAGGPTDRIKKTTDTIISIVSDPALKAADRAEERRKLIREAVDESFDWEAFARGALARHWRKRTDNEKREFTSLFAKLIERTYLDKVGNYSGEKVYYIGETIDGKYGMVKVKVVTDKDQEVSVNYRLKSKGKEWFVYDVSIEGVSLVNNYRVQFGNILMRSSYKELVNRLKKKIENE